MLVGGDAQGDLDSLIRELATILGPGRPPRGVGRIEYWISRVGEGLARAEAVGGDELRERIAELEAENRRLDQLIGGGIEDAWKAGREAGRREAVGGDGLVELLTSEQAREEVVDFFDAWRFCPVSRSGNAPRACLEDAAQQLLAAIAARLSSREQEAADGVA